MPPSGSNAGAFASVGLAAYTRGEHRPRSQNHHYFFFISFLVGILYPTYPECGDIQIFQDETGWTCSRRWKTHNERMNLTRRDALKAGALGIASTATPTTVSAQVPRAGLKSDFKITKRSHSPIGDGLVL